jgi:ketosteroid isomerase-like protein
MNNEQIIRRFYHLAEIKDFPGSAACFTKDGTFTNESIGVTYSGPEITTPGEQYAEAFPDMHRELFRIFSTDNMVIVELALQGTHTGPLRMPMGVIAPTGKKMDAPCCDVFRLKDGKIESFDCYPSVTVMLAQLGILLNLQAAITR